jgi:hypothetical protein
MLCNQLLPPKIEMATFPAEQYDHRVAPAFNHVSVDVSAVLSVPSEFNLVQRA